MAQVVAERPDAQLWVAGDGEEAYVQQLQETVATHGLGDSVLFLGFVSGAEKERVLREAWAFALPSHQENFGVAVLEAVAAGLPVVISGEVQLRAFMETVALQHCELTADVAALMCDDRGRRTADRP